MTGNPSVLAILTARGGSKRIPRKNIRVFHGKPIIHYPIAAAIQSGAFYEVMVSTDDAEIANIAQKGGAKVPFMRSSESANDHASIVDVLTEVLHCYKKMGLSFTHFGCIYPTAVFATSARIREGLDLMLRHDADSLIAVTRFGFPIQRALMVRDGLLSMREPEFLDTRSQDLPAAYHDSGQFFFCKTESFLRTSRVLMDRTLALEIPEAESQDVDSEQDWLMAELKYERLKRDSV